MSRFNIATTIPAEVADNGTVRMGGAIKAKCLPLPYCPVAPAPDGMATTHYVSGFFATIGQALVHHVATLAHTAVSLFA